MTLDRVSRSNAEHIHLNPFLLANSLSVVRKQVVILRPLTIKCAPGEIVCLSGPNGCGKTTFLNVCSGFHELSSGELSIFGVKIREFSPLQMARRGVSRSFQTPFIVPRLSVLDNILLGKRLGSENFPVILRSLFWRHGVNEKILIEAADLLNDLGLSTFVDKSADELSTGQRRRLDVGRAIFSGANLILLDEPFANLDTDASSKLSELIVRLKQKNKALVIVEHQLSRMRELADHVVILK